MSKPRIEIGNGPASIRAITEAISQRQLPEVYVTNGRVVHVEEVSGSAAVIAGNDDSPLSVTASEVGPPGLAALLADHTFTYKVKTTKAKDGTIETYEEETTPPPGVLSPVLARKTWPGLTPMHGIVGAPVLRPDGTLLQEPGYDPETGLYLASKVSLERVPARPTAKQVKDARAFLLDKFLRDFPWESDSDRANYVGILVTPILRRYLHTLIPFAVYTATMPGSGKTILTSGPGMLYGQRVLTWTHEDEELRKTITSVLADPVGTVIFDNIAEGSVIDSPVLARLITDRTWADRQLGKNTTASFANDRLWCATGNNLRLGGDMASRTVLIRLNPNMPRPEERTNFVIPNLDQWILSSVNQRLMLWHLLVLVIDWTKNGAPIQTEHTMRQFTPWAQAIGGFLVHHEIPGFLGNADTVRDIDEEDAAWTAFLGKWCHMHGDKWLTTTQLLDSADPELLGEQWDGLFITDERGRLPNPKSLGMKLTGHIDRWHGSRFRLRSNQDKHSKVRLWRVEVYQA